MSEIEGVEASLAQRCVAILIEAPDIPVVRLADQLGISRFKAKKLAESPAVQAQLASLSDQLVQVAVNRFRGRMESLEVLAYEALKQSLKDKKIEGVKVWAQLVGLSDKKEVEQKDTTIQIILPHMNEKSVPSEVVDVESN